MARIEAEMNRKADSHLAHSIQKQRGLQTSLKFLLMLGPFSVSSLMAANKVSADLQDLPPSASVNAIIQFKGLPSQADLNAVIHAGGVLKQTFQSIHGALFTLKVGQLGGLTSNPNIAYISPDRKIAG